MLMKPVPQQFVAHGHGILREQALQPPIAPIHQQWIFCRFRVLVNRGLSAWRRGYLHDTVIVLEYVHG